MHPLHRALRLLVLTLPLAAGCVAPVPYSPNPGIIEQLGLDRAQSQLAEILSRTRGRRIVDIEVTPEYYAHGGVQWNAWTGLHDGRVQIFYNNVGRTEFYENDRLFVYDIAGRRVAVYDMLTRGDSMLFCDLLAGFKAWISGGWPAPAQPRAEPPPPPARRPEPTYRPQPAPDPAYEEETVEPLKESDPADEGYAPEPESGDQERTRNVLQDE